MKIRILGGALAALAFACALQVQAADNYAVKDGSGATITLKAKEVAGVKAVTHTVANSDGATLINPATSDKQPSLGTAGTPSSNVLTVQGITSMTALKVDGSAVTQPVSGTFWQTTQPVSAASLPLPSGAATAAKQPALGTAGTAASDVLTVQGIASMTALKVDGSAVTQPVSAASLPLPTGAATAANQTNASQKTQIVDGSGNVIASTSNALNVSCGNCSGTSYSLANAATYANTGSYSNVPAGGLVAASAPTYTNGQASPLSLTTAGALRVDGSAVTQPVSGTFWQTTQPVSAASLPLPSGAATSANQSTLIGHVDGLEALVASTNGYVDGIEGSLATLTGTVSAGNVNVVCTSGCSGGGGGAVTNAGTFAVQNTAATPAGSNIIGKVGIDQTTPGTTNGVVVNSSALPTGAATAAKQPALGTAGTASSDVITVQGIASGTPLIAATTVANPTSTLTTPATTTAYSAGDLIANSTTAGSVSVPAITAARISAGSVTIPRVRLNTSATSGWGGVNVQIDLWTAAPTFTNGDNGAYAVATGAAGYIGTATVSLTQYADGAVGTATIVDGPINLKLASGQSIYGTFQILSAASKASGQTFTLTAETVQN